MKLPHLHGVEFFFIPLVTCAYFVFMTDFTWPGALLNNAFVTAAAGGAAWWRSTSLAKWAEKRGDRRERMTPIGPFVVALFLLYFAALQLIAAVTHLSYYRKGPLVADLFDK